MQLPFVVTLDLSAEADNSYCQLVDRLWSGHDNHLHPIALEDHPVRHGEGLCLSHSVIAVRV